MRRIIRGRWVIFTLWLLATVLLAVFQPDVNAILRLRGQQALSKSSPSVVASSILNKMDSSRGSNDIIVFYDKDKISNDQMRQIERGIEAIADNCSKLGISNIIDPFSMPEARGSLISKDGTTLMMSFKLNKGTREVVNIKSEIERRLTGVKSEYYLSGEDFINNDYLRMSMNGVDKSAKLTVIFILIVLVLMFRSLTTPLVSLLAVAFSYLCSMGIAAQLIDKANFPVTSLTQMLLILILFGIGTDYNILLFNRFKEELSRGCSIDDSIVTTYKTAGKTIAFSIVTVFIAFLSLVLADTPIYQSGVVVVIGVSVLLLEILTLTPCIMKVLGNKLFWPSKGNGGHHENKYWGKSATMATKHPIIAVAVILLIILPTVLLHEQKLNFDTIKELGNSAPSSKGFNLVAEHFGKGQAMPSSIVIEGDKPLDNNESLAVIDSLTERLKKIHGVKRVSSVTQPQFKRIDSFYISDQTKFVTNGLTKTQDGTNQIYDGLVKAQAGFGTADFSKADQMINGTAKLYDGMAALTNGLRQIQSGIADNSTNSQTIRNGIAAVRVNLSKVSSGVGLLADSYSKMQAGYSQIGTGYQQAAQALLGVKAALAQMQSITAALGGSYSNAKADINYLSLKQTIDQLLASLSQITPEGIKTLNENYDALTSGFSTANRSLTGMGDGLSQMADGLKKLEDGIGKASSGISVVITNMDSITAGLGQMKSGQQKLVSGLNGFSTFGQKLSDINNGLKQISNGLGQTSNFLAQFHVSRTFFIPEQALTNVSFQKALDAFMSRDRRITKMSVVLDADPYSPEALSTIDRVNRTVRNTLDGTVLSDAKAGVAGPSATASDMKKVLNSDLNRMTIIVTIGILLVLIFVIRSIWEPIVITASLLGAYYASIFVLNRIYLDIKGLDGVQSFVPFFAFIVIVALGVDYSIFLMMRFKEYPHMSHMEAITLASKHIGAVVMSAVVILGGTFATLIPSGLSVLVQLAVAVITGLSVLCFILLPIFLPAMIALPNALSGLLSRDKTVVLDQK